MDSNQFGSEFDQKKADSGSAQDLTPQKVLEYLKENWRLVLSEVVAVGVNSYLEQKKSCASAKATDPSSNQKETSNATH